MMTALVIFINIKNFSFLVVGAGGEQGLSFAETTVSVPLSHPSLGRAPGFEPEDTNLQPLLLATFPDPLINIHSRFCS